MWNRQNRLAEPFKNPNPMNQIDDKLDGWSVRESTAGEYKKRVSLAMNYIARNLHRELSLEEIAGVAFFSEYHFHRIFTAVVGEIPGEFTRRIRMEVAANRLISPKSESVTAIALDLGYASSQNFARAFRKHFGMTPSMFRNSKKRNKFSKVGNETSRDTLYPSNIVEEYTYRSGESVRAEVKILNDMHVAYVRRMGRYGKETSREAFSALRKWAQPAGFLNPGVMLGMCLDNPEITPPEKCRTDACIKVPEGTMPEGEVELQTIQGGRFLVCHFEIERGMISDAWEDSFVFLVRNDLECDDRPPFEMFSESLSGTANIDLSICIPLR